VFVVKRIVIVCVCSLVGVVGAASAQEAATATPIPISLVTLTPNATMPLDAPTATWTPTAAPLAVLEPLDSANVRSEPDVAAQQLGVIRVGEVYTVTGRYFEWYQFQYDGAPTGRAWVFGQLVTITGDPSTIPDLSEQLLPTTDPLLLSAEQTQQSVVLTPGGAETATAAARGVVATLQLPSVGGNSGSSAAPAATGSVGTPMPTFTYPPGVVRVTPVPVGGGALAEENAPLELTQEDIANLPPIVPILAMGALGAVGLVVSRIARK
jgi:Bacterial SH3 domain